MMLRPLGAASTYTSLQLAKAAVAQALNHFDVTVDGILGETRPSGAVGAIRVEPIASRNASAAPNSLAALSASPPAA
jgi:hypothetical protein